MALRFPTGYQPQFTWTPGSDMNNSSPNTEINPSTTNIVAAILVGILVILTIIGNVLVCVSFSLFADLRTICNYFVVSLSAADILVALVAMPFWCGLQITSNRWIFGRELRLFWTCMDILCGTASIMNLMAVSIDRHFAITMPFFYENKMSPKKAIIIICFVWVYATVISGLRLLQWNGNQYMNVVAFGSFFCPLVIMIVMYLRIYLVARKQVRRIGRNYMSDVKAAKTIAVVIGVFVICWSPFFVIVLLFAHNSRFFVSMTTLNVIKWLEYLNSCLNPFIYTCLNRSYRRAFRKLFVRFVRFHRQRSSSTNSQRSTRANSDSASLTYDHKRNRRASSILGECIGHRWYVVIQVCCSFA